MEEFKVTSLGTPANIGVGEDEGVLCPQAATQFCSATPLNHVFVSHLYKVGDWFGPFSVGFHKNVA